MCLLRPISLRARPAVRVNHRPLARFNFSLNLHFIFSFISLKASL